MQEIFTAFIPQFRHDYAYFIQPMVLEVLATYHIHDLVKADERLNVEITIAVFTNIELA